MMSSGAAFSRIASGAYRHCLLPLDCSRRSVRRCDAPPGPDPWRSREKRVAAAEEDNRLRQFFGDLEWDVRGRGPVVVKSGSDLEVSCGARERRGSEALTARERAEQYATV
jgi:hypothetical protein